MTRMIRAKSNMRLMPKADDSLAAMKGAFYDLWMDTEERPVMRRSRNVTGSIDLHRTSPSSNHAGENR